MNTDNAIWKWQLSLNGKSQTFDMPMDTKIIHVAMQNGTLTMWGIIDPQFQKSDKREFIVRGTGHSWIEDEKENVHLGSVIDREFVWHLFEIKWRK